MACSFALARSRVVHLPAGGGSRGGHNLQRLIVQSRTKPPVSKNYRSRVVHLLARGNGGGGHNLKRLIVQVHNAHLQPQVQAVGCGG